MRDGVESISMAPSAAATTEMVDELVLTAPHHIAVSSAITLSLDIRAGCLPARDESDSNPLSPSTPVATEAVDKVVLTTLRYDHG